MFLAWIHSLEKRADRTNFSRRRTLPDLKHQDGYACSRASHRKLQNRSWWTTRQDETDSMAGRQWFTLLLITSNTVQLSQWRKQTISVTSSTSWTASQRSASRGRSSGQRKELVILWLKVDYAQAWSQSTVSGQKIFRLLLYNYWDYWDKSDLSAVRNFPTPKPHPLA